MNSHDVLLARISTEIDVEAEKGGIAIFRNDAMIASVAMDRGATIYTFDTRRFNRWRT